MKNQIKPIFGIKIAIKPAEKQKKTKKTNFRRLWLENGPPKNCFFWFFDRFYKLILVSWEVFFNDFAHV